VTGASVMFSFYKRRVQPIQQRCCLGFEYTGPADPSRMCTEEVPDEVALQRVQRVLLDVNTVPYVPTLYSAQHPPPPVSARLLVAEEIDYCADTELRDFPQGHSELYCSYPPQPDLPRAYHLLPSAVTAAKRARLAAIQNRNDATERGVSPAGEEAEGGPRPVAAVATKAARHAAVQGSSESTGCVGSQASEGTVEEPHGDNSSDQSVELTDALPPVPKGQRQVRKRKAQEVESSRYGITVLANSKVSMVLRTDSVPLQPPCSAARDGARRGGGGPFCRHDGDHRRVGDPSIGRSDPSVRGGRPPSGLAGEEGCQEEVDTVSFASIA
jgi:hypothetical protein